jgi:spore coat polysaccharide biosynthesis protein SpsF (cytidylyltransferase family)
MLTTLGIVEVRPKSAMPRLPACRRLGGKSLLEWVVRRMTESQRLNGVIVLAPQIAEATELAELVPSDVPLLISDRPDALSRFLAALDEYPAEEIVRVVAEHPFVDPVLIDRLVTTAANHREADYIGYCSRNGRPAVISPLGVMGEWIRAKALRQAAREVVDPLQREQVTGHFHSHPEKFALRLIPVPPELDRDDVRLTIGGEEDWEHAQTIYDALGPEQLDYLRIAQLLDHQPALRQRMAALNRTVGAI